jgi:broad specificity phosphatase PhoE
LSTTPEDPPLTQRGYENAEETLGNIFKQGVFSFTNNNNNNKKNQRFKNVVLYVSPFLRCLQTASALMESCKHTMNFTKIIIENKFCEVFNPKIIKNCRDETKGPKLLENPEEYLILPPKKSRPEIIRTDSPFPEWNESREEAYLRIRTKFREMIRLDNDETLQQPEEQNINNKNKDDDDDDAAEETTSKNEQKTNENEGADLVVIVTHGDGVNACITALHPKRVVYNCEYLGHVLIKAQPGGEFIERTKTVFVAPIPVVDKQEEEKEDNIVKSEEEKNDVVFKEKIYKPNAEVISAKGVEWFDDE